MSENSAQPGYNIIEKEKLEKNGKYIVPKAQLGIIQFLRNLKTQKEFQHREYVITGFDLLFFNATQSKEIGGIVRDLLAEAKMWIPKGLVFILPVDAELLGNSSPPTMRKGGREVRLRWIFGNRVERIAISRCHSPFNIHPKKNE